MQIHKHLLHIHLDFNWTERINNWYYIGQNIQVKNSISSSWFDAVIIDQKNNWIVILYDDKDKKDEKDVEIPQAYLLKSWNIFEIDVSHDTFTKCYKI